MARRNRRQDGADGGADELSATVVESLLQDGYSAEEIAAFYDLPVRRVRRFLRRHGLEAPGDAEVGASAASREQGGNPWDEQRSGPPEPWTGRGRAGAPPAHGRGRRLSAAQLDELCTLYLDPSLSIGEVASYFDLDQETAMALIDERLTGIVPRA